MTLDLIFFLLLAVIAIATALGMLLSRNAIYSALFLVLNFVTVAVFYLLLGAPFISLVQITVYAGAIMVLFLFVIMLLDVSAEERRALSRFGLITGVLAVGALALILVSAILGPGTFKPLATPGLEGGVEPLGRVLFLEYVLPFEVLSVLLLVAMVGVVLLSKRDIS